jgi:large repetitive protein
MKTSFKLIMYIQTWRLAAITLGSALAVTLATTAFAANSAPTAVATISPSAVWQGDTVTLDASGSHSNPPGSPLDYQWQQQAGPTVTLVTSNTVVSPHFTAPAVPLAALTQAVTLRVKVTDNLASGGDKNSFSTPVTTTVYAPPGADAGPDAHVYEGSTVQLMGSATRTQPGATVSYTWTAPAGITFLDTSTQTSNLQNPTFTAPSVGPAGQVLTFNLVVTEHLDGLSHDQNSAADSVTINVDNVNAPPTAITNTINDQYNIVPMATVAENTVGVTLYGFGTDPDNDALTFSWTQVQGPTVALSDDTSSTPTFTAPDLTTEDHVDLVFRLIVNDGLLNSGPSDVTIRVLNTNAPPVAVPSATPASAFQGDTVTLDGSGSNDPNNDSLTYTWEQINAPPAPVVTLTPSGSNASFTAPPVSAMQGSITLDFQLTVFDGQLSDTKPISVNVSHVNQAPVADAGDDQPGVPELSNTCLDGSGSYDPDGDTDSLTYAWTQMDGPAVTLDNPSSSGPCFDTPNVGPGGADLVFQLTVTDSHGLSNSDTGLVHVNYVNHAPTANAGDDQGVNEGETMHLSGSGSDPDGNTLTFTWSQLGGPAVSLNDQHDPYATFTAPQVPCAGGVVVMRLTVDDTYGGVTTDDVQITVANVNNLPTADAGMNQQVQEGNLVSLHGSGADDDGEALTFQWNQVNGPSVTLTPASGQDASFIAPSVGSGDPNAFVELQFTLTVMDTCGGSTTTLPMTVHVANIPHAPVAVATGNPLSANEGGTTVQLDGSMSSDPDLDPLTYTWAQISGPAVTLLYSPGDTAHVMPSFATPWVSANAPLKFKLTVSDPWGGTSDAYVCVNVINSHTPPDASHAYADVLVLWPPDHKMALVHILGLVNPNHDPVTIDGVTQDEPTNGLGDGDTPIDAIISGDSVTLRAERSGNGNGRVYRVCFTVHDPEQDATGCVNVMVPKSKKTDVAIDSGGNYDSAH